MGKVMDFTVSRLYYGFSMEKGFIRARVVRRQPGCVRPSEDDVSRAKNTLLDSVKPKKTLKPTPDDES